MNKIRIEINIDNNFFTTIEKHEIIYYHRGKTAYKDEVSYNENLVSIFGTRSKINKLDILENPNSTFYITVIKSLLYIYYNNYSFNVSSIDIYIDNKLFKSYSDDKIKQNFCISSCNTQKISCTNLFCDKEISDTTMKALMNLTLSNSYKEISFEYKWKCFNTLIRYLFTKNNTTSTKITDFSMLVHLKKKIESKDKYFKSTIYFLSNKDDKYFENLSLNSMICNLFPENAKNNKKNMREFFLGFSDCDLSKVLLNKMQCKSKELKKLDIYDEIEKHYLNNINSKINVPIDKVRLMILKHAYYLRCKYFHGEKIPSSFLIANSRQEELDKICEPLHLICKDLIENMMELVKT